MSRRSVHIGHLILFLVPILSFSQELKKFTYGGSTGKRHKGTFELTYYAESGNRQRKIDLQTNTIDLNDYREEVSLWIQVSDLKVGLNNSYSKTKHKDHYRVFYLELTKMSARPTDRISKDTIKISSKVRHYGENVDGIRFKIPAVTEDTHMKFKVKTRIIDGIYDEKWDGIVISKTIKIKPRQAKALDSLLIQGIALGSQTSKKKKRYTGSWKKRNKEETQTVEQKLWVKIEDHILANRKDKVLASCKVYRMNCEQQLFTECEHSEEVLFFMINLTADQEQSALIEEYTSTYPQGRFAQQVATLNTVPEIEVPPIQYGDATIDFDENAIVISDVKGGQQPYYVSFFDYQKNKEFAVKRLRFTSKNLLVNLASLEIPEGYYAVKVMDAQGQLFNDKVKVFISATRSIPKSIQLSIGLVFALALGFFYKKYIHF